MKKEYVIPTIDILNLNRFVRTTNEDIWASANSLENPGYDVEKDEW